MTSTLKNLIAVAILTLLSISVCLAHSKTLIIDTLMHRLAERGQFNGSVLVAEKGRVIYEGGFGMASMEKSLAFTPATVPIRAEGYTRFGNTDDYNIEG